MGLRHNVYPFHSVQFHPESICTEYGRQLIENFRVITRTHWSTMRPKPEAFDSTLSSCMSLPSCSEPPSGEGHVLVWDRVQFCPSPSTRCLHDAVADWAERVFTALYGDQPNAFWLDSARGAADARFSFMGSISDREAGPLAAMLQYSVSKAHYAVSRPNREVSSCYQFVRV